MSSSDFALATTLWVCLALVLYVYVGYPLAIYVLARLFGRRRRTLNPRDEDLPSLSLLVAAYNEESVIEERLQNALAMDYPREKLEIVVATDGCSDRTAEIVRGYADQGVRLIEFQQRRGKAAVLNSAFALVKGEIVVLSDANTFTDPTAARNLARWFQDPGVTAVCGKLVLTDPKKGSNVDSLYWKYETLLKRCEGRLGALLGANGGIYAIHRSRYVPIPEATILDDLVIPLLSRLHHGGDIVYDCHAVAHEETPAHVGAEFHRRSRIGAGGFGSIGLLSGLLNPRSGWVFFTFLSHKVLRWCCPFFLLGLMVTNVLLWNTPFYRRFLIAQFLFYATAWAVAYVPGRSRAVRLLRLTTMFVSMNGALLIGFIRWLCRTQNVTWKRTDRVTEAHTSGGRGSLDGDVVVMVRPGAPVALAETKAGAVRDGDTHLVPQRSGF